MFRRKRLEPKDAPQPAPAMSHEDETASPLQLKKAPKPQRTFFSRLNSYSEITRVTKFLLLVLVIITVTFLCVGYRFYADMKTSSDKLLQDADSLTKYLVTQRLLTGKTFAARIVIDYYSVTFETAKHYRETMTPYLFTVRSSQVKDEFENRLKYIIDGELHQEVLDIEYAKITQRDYSTGKSRIFKRTYFQIPITVRVYKHGTEEYYDDTFICAIELVKSKPSEGNPTGFFISKIGKEVRALKK